MPTNLDIDLLRTLVAICDAGGVNRAASWVGRSQSAVSLQVRRLEQQVGAALFRKQGRGLALTEAGDVLLDHARRILALNDDAVAAVKGVALEGSVRFGLPSDFAEMWLPAALGRFKRVYPEVHVEARVDRNVALLEALDAGRLDLGLAFGGEARTDAHLLQRLPMAWIGPRGDLPWRLGAEPVPLVLFETPCLFRQAGLEALNRAGIAWRISVTTPSLAGIWAAVQAGLGITLRFKGVAPESLAVLNGDSGLPDLPAIALALHDGGRPLGPAAQRLKESVLETLPFC